MTTPDVPLRLEFEIEVPGTPEQVWDALATAAGISAWFLPTDSDERLGGRLVTHMGPEDTPADIVGWDPPHRFAYEEDISVGRRRGARRRSRRSSASSSSRPAPAARASSASCRRRSASAPTGSTSSSRT